MVDDEGFRIITSPKL